MNILNKFHNFEFLGCSASMVFWIITWPAVKVRGNALFESSSYFNYYSGNKYKKIKNKITFCANNREISQFVS